MTGPDPQALDAAERTVRRVMADGATYADSGYIARAAVTAYVGASSEQRPAPGLAEAAREVVRIWRTPASRGMVFTEVIDRLDAALPPKETPAVAARDWRIDAWEPVVVAARDARHLLRAGQTDEALDVLIVVLDRLDAALKEHDA